MCRASYGMKSQIKTVFTTDPPAFLLKDLTVRPLKDEEHGQAAQLLEQEHYPWRMSSGASIPTGR